MAKQPPKSDKKSSPKPEESKGKELPLVPEPPNEEERSDHPIPDADPLAKWRAAREMEEEMADLFDEDRVKHRHGDTEPEAD